MRRLLFLSPLLLSGCIGFSPDGGMTPVAEATNAHLGQPVAKIESDEDRAFADQRVAARLAKPLTPAAALEIALLRNQKLQAALHELGASEARFVRASLPPDPSFSIERLAGMGDIEVTRQIMVSLYALATLPSRQAIAAERFAAAQNEAAAEVMTLARSVGRQYYLAVAAQSEADLLAQTVAGTQASAELAKQLGEAGNLNKLEQARTDAFHAEMGGKLADARLTANLEREKLTRLMGLWGADIHFKLAHDLPALPKKLPAAQDIEATALQERQDIKAARHNLEALAGELGLTEVTRYVSDVSLTLGDDREWAGPTDGSKLATQNNDRLIRRGFSVDFSIPIYDFGESKVRDARETYMAAAHRLAQKAIDARSQARETYARMRGKYELAHYYTDHVLPLRQTILNETTMRSNAMLEDVPQLIIDSRDRIASRIDALHARRDFFIAQVDLQAALFGAVPDEPTTLASDK